MGVFTQSAPRGFRGKLFEINWAFVLLILGAFTEIALTLALP